jgi:hypothetical protein
MDTVVYGQTLLAQFRNPLLLGALITLSVSVGCVAWRMFAETTAEKVRR